MQQRYAISDSLVMQLRFLDMPINARPQCLQTFSTLSPMYSPVLVGLGAGGMRAQPVKIYIYNSEYLPLKAT